MTGTQINIEALLAWSEPKRVQTKFGDRILRKGAPTEEFKAMFGSSKRPGPAYNELKAAGIGWSQDRDGSWVIAWWGQPPKEEQEQKAKMLEASRATDAAVDLPRPAGLDYMPFQRAGISFALNALKGRPGVLVADEMGLGKAQPLTSKILTPTGWRFMGEIKLGDLITGADGKPTRVIGVFPQGEKNCYRVTFSDGATTECCDEHLWEVCTARDRWSKSFSTVKTLGEIRESLHMANGNSVHFIPVVKPVEFAPYGPLPLHPYVVGALIGDGGTSTPQVRFASVDMDIITRMQALLPDSVSLKRVAGTACDYNITKKLESARPNPVSIALNELGLRCRAEDKFVPCQYLYASVEDRIELLRGLCDTDGTVSGDGCVEFTTVSSELAGHVRFLVQSLGGVVRTSTKRPCYKNRMAMKVEGQLAYRLIIGLPAEINPFFLPRKADKWQREKYPPSRAFRRVELVGRKPMQCIKVDAQDQLYVTDDCIVTHNTIQAIGVINASPEIRKVLVFCPASLKLNWHRELRKWLTRPLTVGVGHSKCVPSTDIVILNYDIAATLRRRLEQTEWDAVVCDEVHLLKNKAAQRTKAIFGYEPRRKEIAAGAVTIPPLPAKKRIGLSGTPLVNKPAELFPIINWVDPSEWPSFWRYAKRYCNTPEAPIWMADLTFKPLGQVRVGDEVVGWERDDVVSKDGKHRDYLTKSTVLALHKREAHVVKLTMASGRIVRCTMDHKWLSGRSNQVFDSKYIWVTPAVGRKLVSAIRVPETLSPEKQRIADWLGGIYDGEGTWSRIAQSQSHNPEVCRRIEESLSALGLEFTATKDRMGYYVNGGRQGAVNFMNWCNPTKTSRIIESALKGRYREPDEIVAMAYDGISEVIGMKTRTGNYVAWGYCSKNCGMVNNGWGVTTDGADNLDELQQRLRSTCMVRRMKKEVLTELPPKRRQVIELPANGAADVIAKERHTHDKWEEEISKLRARVELAKATEDNEQYTESVKALGEAVRVAFDECTKAAHEVAIAKVPYLVPHVVESAEEGKVILFAHHLDVIGKYVAEFEKAGLKPLKITGEVKVEDRQGIVDAFQNDPSRRVIVCGIHAAGVGLTLTASSHVIFAELDWVPANMMQAEDRAHRIGQVDSVLVQHMVMEGSIDVRQANALIRKMDIIDQALDRRHPDRKTPVYEPVPESEQKAQRFGGESVRVKREAYEEAAKAITPEQIAAVHRGMQILAGVCDGAAKLDNVGFSKIDAAIGHSLAEQGRLTARQAVLGQKICQKYRRQLPDQLLEAMGVHNGTA